MTIVIDTPEGIEYAQLATFKAAVRLEALGMKHSSGKSMRRAACRKLGLRANAHADDVIGALNKRMVAIITAKAAEQVAAGVTKQ